MRVNMLDAALELASMGIAIIPLHNPIIKKDGRVLCTCHLGDQCESIGKHPRYDKITLNKGVYNATTDHYTIKQWWEAWPNANIGIATGKINNLIVLDCDTLDAIDNAVNKGIPHTPISETGKGKQFFFAYPSDFVVPNKVKIDGFDFRSDGGLVVAPPSLHQTNKRYKWLVSLETPLADTPKWIGQLLQSVQPEHAAASGVTSNAPATETYQDTRYGLAALKSATAEITKAQNGSRNNTFFENAAQMFNLVAGGELTDATVETTLKEAAKQTGLPHDEIEKTLASARNGGLNNPRNAPHKATKNVNILDPKFTSTDLGNARRVHALYGSSIHWVPHWSTWLIWDSKYWKRDIAKAVEQLAHQMVDQLLLAAINISDDDKRKQMIKFALSAQSRSSIDNMLAVAKAIPNVSIDHSVLDADYWLFNVLNGTIHLKTGNLQPHSKKDMLTRMIPITYDPNAKAPKWLAFLNIIFQRDDQLIDYVQRAVGYSLTGDTGEDCLQFAYGSGGNGKSTFFAVLEKLFGAYAHKAPSSMLTASKFEGIPVDVADLQGKRLVVASEISKGVRWNEAKLKDLTGGDRLTARYMRSNPFTFDPTHKLWIYGNYKPIVTGADPGIWRRMRLIPFLFQIPDEMKHRAFELELLPELPGILNWAIEGCLNWQKYGLEPPQAVSGATRDYQEEMDRLQTYIDEFCIAHVNAKTTFKDLYNHYTNYCNNAAEYKIEKREFRERLERKGYTLKNGTGNALYVFGLRTLTLEERNERDKQTRLELQTMEV